MIADELKRARIWKHPVRIFVPIKKGLPVLALDELDITLIKKAVEEHD